MPLNNLVIQALRSAAVGVIALAMLLLLSAGTRDYWQAWLCIVVFTASTSAIGMYLALKDPALLERRKRFGPTAEQSPAQKIIISLGILSFLGVMVFSALDRRFGWSPVPPYLAAVGDALVALGLFIDLLVFREDTYGASNIQVEEGQSVISTGPYAIVRHPMYAGVLVMVLGRPVALGSWSELLVVVVTTPVLIWRILDEEELLRRSRSGYTAYTQAVR